MTFRAIFSDETGLSCAMKLDDLPVYFSDLFNPLQVPAYFKVSNTWLSLRNKHCRYVPRLATIRAFGNPSIRLFISSEAREQSSSDVRNQRAREEFWEGTYRKSTMIRAYHIRENMLCWLKAENYST